jgi:hypothetical protein
MDIPGIFRDSSIVDSLDYSNYSQSIRYANKSALALRSMEK